MLCFFLGLVAFYVDGKIFFREWFQRFRFLFIISFTAPKSFSFAVFISPPVKTFGPNKPVFLTELFLLFFSAVGVLFLLHFVAPSARNRAAIIPMFVIFVCVMVIFSQLTVVGRDVSFLSSH